MTKLLLAITCFLACSATPTFAQDDDPVAKKVATAKETFYADRDKAEKQLLELMTRRENTAKQAGDLKNLEAIRAEIAAFRSEGTLPKIVSPKDYETAMKIAKTKLENAYVAGIKSYTQLDKLEQAKELQKKLDEFKGNETSTAAKNTEVAEDDPFVPQTVWANQKKLQVITVLEREKNTFRARYQYLGTPKKFDFDVKGTIENGKFSWQKKDAVERNGTVTRWEQFKGTITKDKSGYLIEFKTSNDNDEDTHTLKLQQSK